MADTPEKPVKEPKAKKAKAPALSVVEKTSLNTMLERMNDEYAVILRGSQVLIMRHWIGEDGQSKLIFLNKRDFLLLQENNKLWAGDGEEKRPIKIGQAWLEWFGRKGYEEIYFEPQGKEYGKRYNLWRGFAYKPKQTGEFNLFLAHIKDNICNGDDDLYGWVMAWLADLFQQPARKLGTALVLRGPMGIGKGVFANVIGKLLGIHYMPITQSSQLTGKFNGHMADKLLMFVDEGWWSDERNGAGILRALITEGNVTIEMKGRDAVTIQNFTRFIIAANADWVVPLGMGDERRFVISDVGTAHQRDTDYFKAILAQMANGGYEALLDYLLHYDYDESLPRSIIKTGALCDNKIYSMPDEMKWWHECLIRGSVGDFSLRDTPDNDIACDDFYNHYIVWCEKMRLRPISFNVLPKKLRAAIVNYNRTQKVVDTSGRREWYYYLQSLSDMRHYFELWIGHSFDWDNI